MCQKKGVLHSNPPGLKAKNTIFGCSVSGTASEAVSEKDIVSTCLQTAPLEEDTDQLLQQYWKLEKMPDKIHFSLLKKNRQFNTFRIRLAEMMMDAIVSVFPGGHLF